MSRCGCTSVPATGLSILDTDTINASGAGTVGSPYEFDAIVDADTDNMLDATASGLFVPGAEVSTYTPTLSGGSTIGNGTIEGAYTRIGNTGVVAITLTHGTTTNLSAGMTLSLPSGWTASSAHTPMSFFLIGFTGTTEGVLLLIGEIPAGGTTVSVQSQDGADPNFFGPTETYPTVPNNPQFYQLSGAVLLA